MRIANPPEGWTDDPKEFDGDDEWAADDSIGQEMARSLGAERGQPVLYYKTHDGCDVLLSEAGGKFYIYTLVSQAVDMIIAPTDLDEILDAFRREGFRGWKYKSC